MLSSLPVSPGLLKPLVGFAVFMAVLLLIGKVPIGYNLRNLAVRWKTTFMTALAFTLVVGLLTVMLAFVEGMTTLTEQSGQPGNVVVLSDGATDELVSNLAFSDSGDIDRQPGVLRDEAGLPLSSREVYLVVNQPLPASDGRPARRRFVQLRGIEDPPRSALVHGLSLQPGGAWFSEAGVRQSGGSEDGEPLIEAVLGAGVAKEMGTDGTPLEVGDLFDLGGRKWVVAGIMSSEGSTYGSEVWAKLSLVGPMFGKENYTSIILRTADAEAAESLAKELTTNFKTAAVQAVPETEYFARLSQTNRQFLVAIIFVTVVMAIGGVFGIMNTMFAAISQRGKDIGVLRILGFARWQILVSFLLESLVIALVGGVLGCALGYLCDGATASSIVSGGQGGGGKFVVLRLTVDADILATGLVFTLTMGALGGLAPSLSAMLVKPLESLR